MARGVLSGTNRLLKPSLVLNLAAACLAVTYIRLFGKLHLRDLGLTSGLPRALLFTALLWVLTQIGVALWQLGTEGQITRNEAWRDPGATFLFGELIAQFFGNALLEEVVWRGFVFVQLFLLLQRRGVKGALSTSLLTSQGLFALMHIPFQLNTWGSSWAELPFWILATGVASIIFAVLYVKTQNLFIAVGFHALFNEPTQLFAPPVEPSQIPTTIVTLLGLALVFWPVTGRLWRESAQPLPKPVSAQR